MLSALQSHFVWQNPQLPRIESSLCILSMSLTWLCTNSTVFREWQMTAICHANNCKYAWALLPWAFRQSRCGLLLQCPWNKLMFNLALLQWKTFFNCQCQFRRQKDFCWKSSGHNGEKGSVWSSSLFQLNMSEENTIDHLKYHLKALWLSQMSNLTHVFIPCFL